MPTSAPRQRTAAFVLSVASATATAADLIVHQSDFSGGIDAAWSAGNLRTDATLGRYLGDFSLSAGTTLSLSGLPAFNRVTLSFDLYLFGNWDGNNATFGPDSFGLSSPLPSINGSWTFTNHQVEGQSYPQATPTEHIGPLGASSSTYIYRGFGPTGDGGSWTAHHAGDSFSVTFASNTTQSDEWWGIDNVLVTVSPVPAPPAFALMLAGLAAIGARRRGRFF